MKGALVGHRGQRITAPARLKSGGALPDANLFRISIRHASTAGRLLQPQPVAHAVGHAVGVKPPRAAIALLRGDALVSAHYRLGVGVNHAMETLSHLGELLQAAWAHGGSAGLAGDAAAEIASELLDRWAQTSGAAASGLADYQLAVIWIEAHCGMLLLGERVYRRRITDGEASLEAVPLHTLDGMDCPVGSLVGLPTAGGK